MRRNNYCKGETCSNIYSIPMIQVTIIFINFDASKLLSLQYSCFISYRRNEDNTKFLKNLKNIIQSELLHATGRNRAFLDNDEIRYGAEFDIAIYNAIEDSCFFIPVWHYHYLSIEQLWCAKELYHAIKQLN